MHVLSELRIYVDHNLLFELNGSSCPGLIATQYHDQILADLKGNTTEYTMQEALMDFGIPQASKFDEEIDLGVVTFKSIFLDFNRLTSNLFKDASVAHFGREMQIEITSIPQPPFPQMLYGQNGDGSTDTLPHYKWWDLSLVQVNETYYQNPSAVPLGSPWTHTFKNMIGTNVRTALTDVLGVDNLYLGLRFPVRSLISHVLMWDTKPNGARQDSRSIVCLRPGIHCVHR